MNTGMMNDALRSALAVANLVGDALVNPQIALEMVQHPQHVAANRGIHLQAVQTSTRVVEQGGNRPNLSYWI